MLFITIKYLILLGINRSIQAINTNKSSPLFPCYLHTPHLLPCWLQYLQYLQFLQALQLALPVQVASVVALAQQACVILRECERGWQAAMLRLHTAKK